MAKKNRRQKQQPAATPATVAAAPRRAWRSPRTPTSTTRPPPSYGEEAAEALGMAPEQVFKTLVAEVDGALTVAVVPVSASLDLKALAVGGGRQARRDGRPGGGRAHHGLCARRHLPAGAAQAAAHGAGRVGRRQPRSASRRAAAAWRSSSPPADLAALTRRVSTAPDRARVTARRGSSCQPEPRVAAQEPLPARTGRLRGLPAPARRRLTHVGPSGIDPAAPGDRPPPIRACR